MTPLLIKNGTIVRADGEEKADVLIEDGVIKKIQPATSNEKRATNSSVEVFDATSLFLFPGLIDCHVHFREPGLTHKGDMKSESAAARAGGVLTVCEMPNTNPPTVTVAAFEDKVRSASKVSDCDIHFFFGITQKEHLDELQKLFTDQSLNSLRSRCCGVKLYLDHSTGNQKIEGELIEEVFSTCGKLGVPIVAHCEDPQINKASSNEKRATSNIEIHSQMRPPESEAASVEYAIPLSKKFGTHLHVAHLSTKQGIELVAKAKKKKLKVTCEVAPHHLFLTVDDYEKLGTLAKMNPPLRTKEHQEALWEGIEDGTVDCIATDHAPHTLEEKNTKNPLEAPSGVPGVETMLPLLLSSRVARDGRASVTRGDILRLCFTNPNRIFNLGKQGIVKGAKAEIVLVDPKAEWMIRGKELHSKCGWTPFEHWEVTGKVIHTLSYL